MSAKSLEEAVFGSKPAETRDLPDPAKVRAALDAVRPALLADGGNVELQGIDSDGTVRLVLQGECRACPSVEMTFRRILEPHLKAKIPEIQNIIVC